MRHTARLQAGVDSNRGSRNDLRSTTHVVDLSDLLEVKMVGAAKFVKLQKFLKNCQAPDLELGHGSRAMNRLT